MTAAASRPRRRLATVVGEVLLTLAAIGGVVCIALVALAAFFDITLIMFKTGSMTPTIPAGSLAVVREVPASEVGVGDVVTVDRPGELPVTHRIVSYEAGVGDTATFVMRGDANNVDDPEPYTVDHVREVMFSVPQLAYVVAGASQAPVLGGVTIAAAALVTWAFWPRDPGTPSSRSGGRRARKGGRHAAAAIAVLVLAAPLTAPDAVQAASSAAASSAAADDVTDEPHVQVTRGRILTLTSIGDRDAMMSLDEIPSAPWQVGVSAAPPEPGLVEVSVSADGSLLSAGDDGLWVTVDVCAERWTDEGCPGSGTRVAGPAPASDVFSSPLLAATMHSSEERWIRVEASLGDNDERGLVDLVVSARGSDELLSTGPPDGAGGGGATAVTGFDPRMPLHLALGAVIAGLTLAHVARLRRREALA